MTTCHDGVEDTPRSVTAIERPSVSAPVDLDALLLQREEHHKSGKGDSTRERGRGDTKMKRASAEPGQTKGKGTRTSCTSTTNRGIAS